jgi:hypothetical protein
MFGTLFFTLQYKSMYYAIQRTVFCVRWLILLITGFRRHGHVTGTSIKLLHA